MDFYRADLHKNISGLETNFCCRRVVLKTGDYYPRLIVFLVSVLNLDADPAGPDLTEPHIVSPNLFCGSHRKGVACSLVVNTADQDTDDLTFKIYKRRSALSLLRGHITSHEGARARLLRRALI